MRTLDADRRLAVDLLQLLAAADAACSVLSAPPSAVEGDTAAQHLIAQSIHALEQSSRDAQSGASLCDSKRIDPRQLRVLYRLRTPQRGLTLRSLSHYLALVAETEVIPRWYAARRQHMEGRKRLLNLLLAPWPLVIERQQVRPAPTSRGRLRNLPPGYRFFEISRHPDPDLVKGWLGRLLAAARNEAGEFDAVILPELALHPDELEAVRAWAASEDVMLIAGVGDSGRDEQLGSNYVALELPWPLKISGTALSLRQDKHHRWLLDRSQIETYGLAGHLDPTIKWWEPLALGPRSLQFVTFQQELTICTLVCEDLAQQEPVANVVRAVGPNLVIALLMDGPQLSTRWPARYAAVLGDDPGSSVLTLTSLGMCERSQPFGHARSRTIAMWRDGGSGNLREIELGAGAVGKVLNVTLEQRLEHTADGRDDAGAATTLTLTGAYDVRVG